MCLDAREQGTSRNSKARRILSNEHWKKTCGIKKDARITSVIMAAGADVKDWIELMRR